MHFGSLLSTEYKHETPCCFANRTPQKGVRPFHLPPFIFASNLRVQKQAPLVLGGTAGRRSSFPKGEKGGGDLKESTSSLSLRRLETKQCLSETSCFLEPKPNLFGSREISGNLSSAANPCALQGNPNVWPTLPTLRGYQPGQAPDICLDSECLSPQNGASVDSHLQTRRLSPIRCEAPAAAMTHPGTAHRANKKVAGSKIEQQDELHIKLQEGPKESNSYIQPFTPKNA